MTAESRHIRALDGLRGLAILLVIPHNSEELFQGSTGIVRVGGIIAGAGWIGVQLFFVLSGFLITRNLFEAQGATNYFKTFFARRILRIFPLYYITLIIALILVPLLFTGTPGGHLFYRDELWLWIFLLNWSHPLGASTFGLPHFWSLAVEEQFYFVWPLVVWHATPRSLLKVCAGVTIAAFIARAMLHFLGGTDEMIYEFTVCRMDALAIGAATAAVMRYSEGRAWFERNQMTFLPALAIMTVVGALFTKAYTSNMLSTQMIGHTWLAVLFALSVLACLTDRGTYNLWYRRILDSRVLRSIGRYSYGMYVIHFPIFLWLQKHSEVFIQDFGRYAPLMFVVTVGVSAYCLAVISYHLVEKHFLRLKRYFVPQYDEGPNVAVAPNVA